MKNCLISLIMTYYDEVRQDRALAGGKCNLQLFLSSVLMQSGCDTHCRVPRIFEEGNEPRRSVVRLYQITNDQNVGLLPRWGRILADLRRSGKNFLIEKTCRALAGDGWLVFISALSSCSWPSLNLFKMMSIRAQNSCIFGNDFLWCSRVRRTTFLLCSTASSDKTAKVQTLWARRAII